MKYVLDASVALKWVLTEADSPKALALRDDFRKQVHELLAPDLFPIELAHALTLRLVFARTGWSFTTLSPLRARGVSSAGGKPAIQSRTSDSIQAM